MLEQELAQLIRSCISPRDVKLCHDRARASGVLSKFLANLLLQMYGKCGCMDEAKTLFDSLDSPNVFSWNSLIAAYARNGELLKAREVFNVMSERTPVSWSTMISTYARYDNLDLVVDFFRKCPYWNVVSSTAVLAAYTHAGHLRESKRLFDTMPERNDVSWNTLLSGFSRDSQLDQALEIFQSMPCHSRVSWNSLVSSTAALDLVRTKQTFDLMPELDVFAWTSLLSACSSAGNLADARATFARMPAINEISVSALMKAFATIPIAAGDWDNILDDAKIVFFESPARNLECYTAMITVLSQRGRVEESKRVFDRMPGWDIVSWTEMLAAFGENGFMDRCKALFDRSPERDAVMWTAIIQAYALQDDRADEARRILSMMLRETRHHFERYSRSKTLEQNVIASTIVIAAHARCGDLAAAIELFDRIPQHSSVTRSAMAAARAQAGDVSGAWIEFHSMPERNRASWSAMIAGLAQSGHLRESDRLVSRSPNKDLSCLTALMAGYAQAGETATARKIFDEELRDKADLIAWTVAVAIASSSSEVDHRRKDLFFLPFREMLVDGVRPDGLIFLSLICGCSHRGLLRRGREIFLELQIEHGISPELYHYSAMVDLLGRSGRLIEADELVTTMPFSSGRNRLWDSDWKWIPRRYL